jgi:hypothetical protein
VFIRGIDKRPALQHIRGMVAEAKEKVFLSFSQADRPWADRMQETLEAAGATVLTADRSGVGPGDLLLADLRNAVSEATVLFVLIGPRTRFSKRVDQEIECGLRRTSDRPAPGLVAVILPEHEDFSRPYYDPGNVPLRVDDHVSRESAILRKWSEDPAQVRKWLAEATQRRRRFPSPMVSFATQAALERFAWDQSVEEAGVPRAV